MPPPPPSCAAMSERTDIFGEVRLGYLVIDSARIADWRRFLKDGVGMHEAHAAEDLLAYRMDEHARRLLIRTGSAEDLGALGLQIRGEAALAVILERLRERGVPVEAGSAEEAEQRGVARFLRVQGPKGLLVEMFTEPLLSREKLTMLTSAFNTGPAGMGHIAVTSRMPELMQRFWQEIFDARLSDRISQPMGGLMLDIAFLRLNERHHSIAIAATRGVRLDPIRTRIQHFNVEARRREDLTAAYRRLRELGFAMAHEIGEHPNDRELSFYVETPSGFEMEYGWDALAVKEEGWDSSAHYPAISLWGHKPPNASAIASLSTNLGSLRRGLASLLSPEFSPLRRAES